MVPAWVSFLGGKGVGYVEETPHAAATDPQGAILVGWQTGAQELPLLHRYGVPDAGDLGIVTKLNAAGDRVLFHVAFVWSVVRGLATDAQGNIYVVGDTLAPTEYFPVTNAVQTQMAGYRDAFVAKLSPDGGQLLYCTYLGGNGLELGTGIAVNAAGDAWVTGWTSSTNFPVTAGAAQATLAGGFDAFVSKLSPDGKQLAFSTYLGGTNDESSSSIAVNALGEAWIVGSTTSSAFIPDSWLRVVGTASMRNAYAANLSADGKEVFAVSILGGSGEDHGSAIALTSEGLPVVLGRTESTDFPTTAGCLQAVPRGPNAAGDYFLARLSLAGGYLYSTYLGGTGEEHPLEWFYAQGYYLDGVEAPEGYLRIEHAGLAVDPAGNIYVAGSTGSDDIAPGRAVNQRAGDWDAFLAKLNPAGTELLHFGYLGGALGDWAWSSLALRGPDDVVVAGSTMITPLPPHFPATPGAFQTKFGGSVSDVFVARYLQSAGAPANDSFAQRAVLEGTMLTVRADNSLATREAGEPLLVPRASGKTLWWSWTAPANGRLFLGTDGSREASFLGVYTGTAVDGLSTVASSDTPAEGTRGRRLAVPVQSGQTYQICGDGLDGAAGELALSLAFSAVANDDFADRTRITGFPLTVTGTNIHATVEGGEPMHERYSRHSLWWSWRPDTTRAVRVTSEGSTFLAVATVYRQDPVLGLQRIAGAVGGDEGNPADFTFLAVQGQDYELAIDGYADETGKAVLNLLPGVPPPNDNFANAIELSGFTVTAQGTNLTATWELGEWLPLQIEPQQTDATGGQTVWWSWIAPTNGYLSLSTEGSDFDSVFAVYTGSTLETLARVAIGFDQPGFTTQAYFPVQQGTRYAIQVDATRWAPPGHVELWLRVTQPPEIVRASLVRQADGTVSFQVRGIPGRQYRLQTATDPIAWSTVGEILEGAEFTVTDSPSLGVPHRFYRLIDVTPE